MSLYQLYGTIPHNNSMIPPRPQGVSFRGMQPMPQPQPQPQHQHQHQHQRRTSTDGRPFYDWRLHAPNSKSGWLQYLRWTIEGRTSFAEVSDDYRLDNLQGLAKCLRLLRYYQQKFGSPLQDDGGSGGTVHEQAMVLREITRGLYEGAASLSCCWNCTP
jgi:hypothetical protein